MFEKILIPLDGSELAEKSLDYVEMIARPLNSEVVLLTSCKPNQGLELPFTAYLQQKLKDLDSSGIRKIWSIVQGRPADQILRFSEKNDIDLIIISTHGHTGHREWTMGEVTEEVLHKSQIPVLLIHSADSAIRPNAFKHILVPLDGSQTAERILPYVRTMAQAFEAKVSLLRVIRPMKLTSIKDSDQEYHWAEQHDELVNHLKRDSEHYLRAKESTFTEANIPVSSTIVVGRPSQEVLQYIESESVDLIAMATHGFSGIEKWAYGSVASKVIEESIKPILLFRPPLPGTDYGSSI